MTGHLLEVKHLTVAFGKVLANDCVSLNLSPGETLGIVGESGSGKSVLCRAILGMAKGRSPPAALRLTGATCPT